MIVKSEGTVLFVVTVSADIGVSCAHAKSGRNSGCRCDAAFTSRRAIDMAATRDRRLCILPIIIT